MIHFFDEWVIFGVSTVISVDQRLARDLNFISDSEENFLWQLIFMTIDIYDILRSFDIFNWLSDACIGKLLPRALHGFNSFNFKYFSN